MKFREEEQEMCLKPKNVESEAFENKMMNFQQ